MKKILLTGGGTLGSVTPLIAIKQELDQQDTTYDFLFVGTENGVEKDFVTKDYHIKYQGISSGKLRRYFSLQNFIDPFRIIRGFFDSFRVLWSYKPDLIITAGSFVSVPLVIVGYFFRIPIVVHQLDIKIGLSNRIMSWFAKIVTITFADHLKSFPSSKVVLSGNPVRQELFSGDSKKAQKVFNIHNTLPTILVLGGGIGSVNINQLIQSSIDRLLTFCNIIHVTGYGKKGDLCKVDTKHGVYRVVEFLGKELPDVIALADVVVTRAGLATLSELMNLQKIMIIIPIHHHQQEDNARYFDRKKCGIYIDETISFEKFVSVLELLLKNSEVQAELRQGMKQLGNHFAAQIIAKKIQSLLTS